MEYNTPLSVFFTYTLWCREQENVEKGIYNSLCSAAYFTREAVFFKCNLASIFLRWVFTVTILRKSLSAISWLINPLAMYPMISISLTERCFSFSGVFTLRSFK